MMGHAPEYLTSKFVTRGSVSGRTTRNFQQLNIPRFKTATGQKTFYLTTEVYLSGISSIQA